MLLAERQEVLIMRNEVTIKEFINAMNKEGIESMFFWGGTSRLFGVDNIIGRKVYLDGDKIILTDNPLITSNKIDWTSQEYDKESFINKIKEALVKNSVITEDVLKDVFDIHAPGHLYFKESRGWIEVLGGYRELV